MLRPNKSLSVRGAFGGDCSPIIPNGDTQQHITPHPQHTGELRPTSYELGDDEILCTKENQDGEDEGYGLEDEDEDEEPADDDDEDEEPQDDDDEDYHVGEGEAELDDDGPLSGSKRKASRLEV